MARLSASVQTLEVSTNGGGLSTIVASRSTQRHHHCITNPIIMTSHVLIMVVLACMTLRAHPLVMRREIRSWSHSDLIRLRDAITIMSNTSRAEGRRKFGAAFQPWAHISMLHAVAVLDPRGDQGARHAVVQQRGPNLAHTCTQATPTGLPTSLKPASTRSTTRSSP